jgi:hypothetical protein
VLSSVCPWITWFLSRLVTCVVLAVRFRNKKMAISPDEMVSSCADFMYICRHTIVSQQEEPEHEAGG